jgi:hypothetical protein
MRAIMATVTMRGIDFSDMAFLQRLGTEAQARSSDRHLYKRQIGKKDVIETIECQKKNHGSPKAQARIDFFILDHVPI